MTTPIRIMASLAVTVVSLLTSACFANPSVESEKERMLKTLDTIRELYENSYAPMQWKQEYFGWSLSDEVERAKEAVLAVPCGVPMKLKDYHQAVLDMIHSMRDYHVSVFFWATEGAELPFEVRGADGRYFIVYVDRERASKVSFPFKSGDEIVSFGGRPVGDVVQEIRSQAVTDASPLTDQALAQMYLTKRYGFRGVDVPRGPVSIGVKCDDGKTRFVQMVWKHYEEEIRTRDGEWMVPLQLGTLARARNLATEGANPLAKEALRDHPLLGMQMTTALAQSLKARACEDCEGSDSTDENENRFQLGSRRSYLPRLGDTVYWESSEDNTFDAYAFVNDEGRKIGVIRIADYAPWMPDFAAQDFADIVNELESRTEMLVIDQVNNPGGYVFYLYALASMLTDQPLSTPRHRNMLDQETIFSTKRLLRMLEYIQTEDQVMEMVGPTLLGYPATLTLIRCCEEYCRFVIREWDAGRYFTDPFFFFCVDQINPHPDARYTKPILLLVNELDFSGGDFFPAIMQDNKRATLMGAKTSGAGGVVRWMEFPNRQGIIGMSSTVTIAERVDNNPIENLGVTPDIEYTMTAEDYQCNFKGYVRAIHEAINGLLPPRCECGGGCGHDDGSDEEGAEGEDEAV